MSETYQIVFLKAGDGSASSNQAVAEKIANATKTPLERILKQIQQAPFIYKKGLPKSKADNISAALSKLGAHTEVRPDEAAEPAASPGGFNFGAAPAPPSRPAPSPGGFDFGAPPAARPTDDFSIETDSGDSARPAAPTPASGFGFDFAPQAAASAPPAPPTAAPSLFERNEDFGSAAPAPAPAVKAPPVAASKKARTEKGGTVVCPRCQHEQPPAAECASCGVLMSKAGAEAAAPPRRPRARAAVESKSKVVPIALVAGGLVLALGLAWVTGLLNPLRLRLAVSGDAMLREYGVSVTKMADKFVAAAVTRPEKAKEVLEGFVGRSQHIQAEIDRLSGLSDVAQFDQGAQALQPEIEAYEQGPANALIKRVYDVAGSYVPVSGVGLTVEGRTYTFREMMTQSGMAEGENVEAVLNEVEIRQALKNGRDRAAQQEAARLLEERRTLVNVNLADSFESGLDPRWTRIGEPNAAPDRGRLRFSAQNQALAASGLLGIPEPIADYQLEVTMSGSNPDATRAGVVVYQDPAAWVGVVKTRAGRGDAAQVVTQAGDGFSAAAGRDLRVRLERKGPTYQFFAWDVQRNTWVQLDRVQPAWNESIPRTLTLVGYNGNGATDFDDFRLQVAP